MQESSSNSTNNAIKLLGESFVPGASLMMEGHILAGALHTVVGTLAKAALGPAGLALVIANSFAKASTGKNLLKQFSSDAPAAPRA